MDCTSFLQLCLCGSVEGGPGGPLEYDFCSEVVWKLVTETRLELETGEGVCHVF